MSSPSFDHRSLADSLPAPPLSRDAITSEITDRKRTLVPTPSALNGLPSPVSSLRRFCSASVDRPRRIAIVPPSQKFLREPFSKVGVARAPAAEAVSSMETRNIHK